MATSSNLLYPGQKIVYKEKYEYAVFSGKINFFGITVGHIANGISDELHDAREEQVIAKIKVRIEGTIKRQDEEFTADISLLEMNSCCMVKNILRCNPVGEHRLVLHKGSVSVGERVMVLDEEGYMKQGKIKSSLFNCKDNETGKEVINALCIVDDNNHAIAQSGQSGALVTSCPQPGSDVLRVYGIVTYIHDNNGTTATIANRLWDVLRVFDETLKDCEFA